MRGREPIVIGQANMISSLVDDDVDGAVPSSEPALTLATSAHIVPALPSSTGFFDEEYDIDHGKRVMYVTSDPILSTYIRANHWQANQSGGAIDVP